MLRIVSVLSAEDIQLAQNLFRGYGKMPGVAPCLDDFEREVNALPGLYAPPSGRLLLAFDRSEGNPEQPAGCVALRALRADTCEMKRLYVPADHRGGGVGRALVKEVIAEARSIGYQRMVLDTLPSMQAAHRLYRTLGFREISSYQKNPIPGALFFELALP
jgi:ribosomal protein S18 acetylase RimI-like enzyme